MLAPAVINLQHRRSFQSDSVDEFEIAKCVESAFVPGIIDLLGHLSQSIVVTDVTP